MSQAEGTAHSRRFRCEKLGWAVQADIRVSLLPRATAGVKGSGALRVPSWELSA